MPGEIAPAAKALNESQPCPNCEGTGLSRSAHWVSRSTGPCWACKGRRTVTLSPRDKVFRALRARDAGDEAEWALAIVERDEPHRIERMWTSIEHGRIDAVIAALLDYYATRATEAGTGGRETI